MPSSWKRRHLHRVISSYSDPAFDKGYAFDFFCLEPMSHAPDDHHRPEGGDLIALARGINNLRDVVAGRVAVIYKMPDKAFTPHPASSNADQRKMPPAR